jgi:hypothetical protein
MIKSEKEIYKEFTVKQLGFIHKLKKIGVDKIIPTDKIHNRYVYEHLIDDPHNLEHSYWDVRDAPSWFDEWIENGKMVHYEDSNILNSLRMYYLDYLKTLT